MRLLRGADAKAWFATLAPACTALALGVVLHQWTTGHEGRTAIVFGIYPYSDAGGFWSDTQRMIAGLPFEMASRRPLHAAVTTAMLRASGDDLRFVLAAQAAILGVATAFAASETRRAAGERAAFVVLLVGCFYQRRFAGFVATEAFGWPLGALAFGLFLRAREKNAAVAIFAGALALSLALFARAGPMLVVPSLVAWAFTTGPKEERLARTAAAAGGAALAFALNAMLAREVAAGGAFIELPPILYGALHHDDFTRIFADHPELLSLGATERYDAMMRIVRHDAWAQPSLIVSAALSSLSSFFGAPEGLFSFVWNTPDDHVFEGQASPGVASVFARVLTGARELGPYGVANIVAMGALAIAFVIAFVVGLVRAWRARTNGVARLVLFVAAGALASIPFTPPWITSTVQVDTSVLPFLVLAAAFALGVEDGEAATSPQRPAILLGAFVALATLGIAFVLARPERPSDRRCSAETMTMRADPSTRLVVGDDPPASMAVLAANAYFLRRHDASFVEALEREVRPGRAMVLVYDACGSEGRLAIGDEAAIPRDRAWHTVTFVPTADPFVVAVGP